jgi:hypothetical protein
MDLYKFRSPDTSKLSLLEQLLPRLQIAQEDTEKLRIWQELQREFPNELKELSEMGARNKTGSSSSGGGGGVSASATIRTDALKSRMRSICRQHQLRDVSDDALKYMSQALTNYLGTVLEYVNFSSESRTDTFEKHKLSARWSSGKRTHEQAFDQSQTTLQQQQAPVPGFQPPPKSARTLSRVDCTLALSYVDPVELRQRLQDPFYWTTMQP